MHHQTRFKKTKISEKINQIKIRRDYIYWWTYYKCECVYVEMAVKNSRHSSLANHLLTTIMCIHIRSVYILLSAYHQSLPFNNYFAITVLRFLSYISIYVCVGFLVLMWVNVCVCVVCKIHMILFVYIFILSKYY